MRVLITGGSGVHRLNLARAALAEGHEIVVLDDLSTGFGANLAGLDVRFHQGRSSTATRSTPGSGADAVVHLAALGSVPRSILDPVATHHANATGTLSVLEGPPRRTSGTSSCRRRRRSTGSTSHCRRAAGSGCTAQPVRGEQTRRRAVPPRVQQSFGLETLAFRLFNVYGPRQMPGPPTPPSCRCSSTRCCVGCGLPVHGDGLQSRDFTYVGTVCAVLLDAVTRRVSHPEPVNLAFGTNTTVRPLVEELEEVSGLPADVVHEASRPGDVRASQGGQPRPHVPLPLGRPGSVAGRADRDAHLVQGALVESTSLVVVGQGYVGVPMAVRASEAGLDVVGLDTE